MSPAPDADLGFMTIVEASRQIATGALSPVELMAAHLRRIEALGAAIGCVPAARRR